jgi:hypothetical protein
MDSSSMTNSRRFATGARLVVIVLGSSLSLAACGGSGSGSGTAANERAVSRSDYGSRWPLTVDSGTLRCDQPGSVTFSSGGTTYWVNGTAGGVATDNGWQDIQSIWADDPSAGMDGIKIGIGPLIDDGLALCG